MCFSYFYNNVHCIYGFYPFSHYILNSLTAFIYRKMYIMQQLFVSSDHNSHHQHSFDGFFCYIKNSDTVSFYLFSFSFIFLIHPLTLLPHQDCNTSSLMCNESWFSIIIIFIIDKIHQFSSFNLFSSLCMISSKKVAMHEGNIKCLKLNV